MDGHRRNAQNLEVDAHRTSRREGLKRSSTPFVLQVLLLAAVVLLGCATIISRQIAAQPLKRYTSVLVLYTAVIYLPLYWLILSLLLLTGAVPWSQLRFVWTQLSGHGSFPVAFFAICALGDSVGDTIQAICVPHVSGPVHSLANTCISIFIAMLSMCVFNERYSLTQCAALLAVFAAVVIGFVPSLEGSTTTDPAFAVIAGGSCFFYAVSFVVKELVFKRFKVWQAESHCGDAGLNIFVMNAHLALFQLPLTILLIPLNELLKQTNGEGIVAYSKEAFDCVFYDAHSCGPESNHGELAGLCVGVCVAVTVLWNLMIVLCVKHTGALATNIALKAIFPVSAVLFAYVDWPLLGPTRLSWLVWLSILLLVPSIGAYQWATHVQAQRGETARCCLPSRPPGLLD
ncbi:unnamed protein product [Effrenium voratum]|nr:unnamed protein product [Effrenium voratum]|mmetsp:Transcript_65459/g.156369  ORF Transcript_65459/g.156369 Transcript_65459/m.156369 type:complete len:402 (-) Transcript_65459:84-1289(-)